MKLTIPKCVFFGLSLGLASVVVAEEAYITYHLYESSTSTNTLACSDGANGLQETFGYYDLSAMFPMVSATSNVHWNSPNCGNCYKLTGPGGNTVYVTAVDMCGAGPEGEMHFDMAPGAFNALLGDDGVAAGSGYADFELVDGSNCVGNLGGPVSGPAPQPSNPAPTPPVGNAGQGGTCGGGSVGNGICADPSLCCSQWGWCGTVASGHCTGPAPPAPAPTYPTAPQPTNPAPTPPSGPTPPTSGHGNGRMIAYLGNWQACPTAAQLAQYTHIVIAFAVSYTWAPGKNNCSPTCEIATPPICNNNANQFLLDELRAQGKKIIVSFGGAGMGGSWAGDQNDCWDYCYGREVQVVNRLAQIVDELNADGIDIDYEYFYEDNQNGSGFNKGAQAQKFLKDITLGLHDTLLPGSEITHAPMDVDMQPQKAYFRLLKEISHTLDFLMPQYYNGVTRPAVDGIDGTGSGSVSAMQHYTTIVNEFFGGDATRMVFGFCISDCGASGSNANGQQAAQVMTALADTYSCHGGAFFWVVEKDTNGGFSSTVNQAMANSMTCSGSAGETPRPTVAATTQAPVPPSPTPNLRTPATTPRPTQTPAPAPTDPSGDDPCCPSGYNGVYPKPDCSGFIYCYSGNIVGNPVDCPPNTMFDATISNCNHANMVSCDVGACE